MTLARSWIRQLLGASLGGMLAPGALLAAILVLGLGGGLGTVSSLGQLLSGPPTNVQRLARTAGPRAGSQLALAALRASVAAASPAPAAPAAPTRATGGAPAHGHAVSTAPLPRLASTPSRPGPVSRRASSRPAVAARPAASAPSLADQVAAAGQSLTSSLPAPVGAAAGQALGTVATTVDHLLPGSGSRARAPQGAAPVAVPSFGGATAGGSGGSAARLP